MGEEGGAGWSGVKRGKWDNCNNIINKYIKKNYIITRRQTPVLILETL